MKRILLFSVIGMVMVSVLPPQSAAAEPVVTKARVQELSHLVKHDCGSCHGMSLKGGLGRALRAQDLAPKPVAYLRETILNGIPGTAMPPWKGIVTEAEADWIARALKTGELEP